MAAPLSTPAPLGPNSSINTSTLLCANCALSAYKELVYVYRATIPRDQLPAEVTARSDCW